MHACARACTHTHTHTHHLCLSHTQSLKLTTLHLKLGPLWHIMLKCLDYPWYCISTSYSHSVVNSFLYHSTSLKNLFIIKMLFLWFSILSSSRKWTAVRSHSIHIRLLKCPHYRLREEDWLIVLKNRVLKKIHRPIAEAVTGGCRKYCYDDKIKQRLETGYGEWIAEMRRTYKPLIAKHEEKSPQQYMKLWTGFLWLWTQLSRFFQTY